MYWLSTRDLYKHYSREQEDEVRWGQTGAVLLFFFVPFIQTSVDLPIPPPPLPPPLPSFLTSLFIILRLSSTASDSVVYYEYPPSSIVVCSFFVFLLFVVSSLHLSLAMWFNGEIIVSKIKDTIEYHFCPRVTCLSRWKYKPLSREKMWVFSVVAATR